MRIRLHEIFDWRPPGKRSLVSYRPGDYVMRRIAGEEAIRLGKGVEVGKTGNHSPFRGKNLVVGSPVTGSR